MANFKITRQTTVSELKEQFRKEFGGVLRVYEGRSEANDSAKLVSLGAKEGEFECRANRTVGSFEEDFKKEFNLKVKVYTKDNWVAVLDGITLASVNDIPKSATKASMEEFVGYKRDEKKTETVKKPTQFLTYEECVAKYPAGKDGNRYTISDDGKTITPSEALKGSLVIPEGVEILNLDYQYRNEDVTAVIMPDSIKEIQGFFNGFYCKNLEFVRLSKNLTVIPRDAFENCKLKEITIPEGVRIIEAGAFRDTKISSLQLPDSLEYILPGAFSSTEIENLTIPENVKLVDKDAFYNCKKLKNIEILSKDTVIIKDAFDGCGEYDDDKDFIVNYDVKKIYEEHALGDKTIGADDVRYEIIDGVKTLKFVPPYYCGIMKIEDGTEASEVSFYSHYDNITELWIPDSMKDPIGRISIENLKSVHFPSSFEEYRNWDSLINISSEVLKSFNFPKGLKKIVLADTLISELAIPEGVEEVELTRMKELEKLSLPSSVKSCDITFCPKLEELIVPEKVLELCRQFCDDCSSLKKVELPSDLKRIGESAFSGCTSLEKITIPASVESIEGEAFKDCTNLKDVTIEGNPKIAISAFENCPGYTVKTTGLTSTEWDEDGLPLVSLNFQRFFFRKCSEERADDYISNEGSYEEGIFIACGSNDFTHYPFDNIKYMAWAAGMYDEYTIFKDEDENECLSILGYGNMLYAEFDSNDYPDEFKSRTVAALEIIFDVPQDKRGQYQYEGPEAIFKISITNDSQLSDDEIFNKRFRIFKDDNDNWISEELPE